jgi:hypothetical protein
MITAQKAKELADTSDNNIENYCEMIGVVIEQAAKLGKRSLLLDESFHSSETYKVTKPAFYPADFNDVQRRIKKKLEENGFFVKIIEQKHDGRGGLGCMDEDPQPFSTYHIKVSW